MEDSGETGLANGAEAGVLNDVEVGEENDVTAVAAEEAMEGSVGEVTVMMEVAEDMIVEPNGAEDVLVVGVEGGLLERAEDSFEATDVPLDRSLNITVSSLLAETECDGNLFSVR